MTATIERPPARTAFYLESLRERLLVIDARASFARATGQVDQAAACEAERSALMVEIGGTPPIALFVAGRWVPVPEVAR